MKFLPRLLLVAAALAAGVWLSAAERIPPKPAHYFNDYAGAVSRPAADELNRRLEQYERESSNQLVVAIFPRMESGSSVEDYTVRVAQVWGVGQKGRNNGAVLFAFMQEHQLYLQVGYGLESVLPDATARRIIEDELKPRFRAGDFDDGMRAAVAAMIAATKGEYRGTGRTQAEGQSGSGIPMFWVLAIVVYLVLAIIRSRRHGVIFAGGRTRRLGGVIWSGGGSGWSGGGGSSGGFSGGGGSFGGGGAGGSW